MTKNSNNRWKSSPQLHVANEKCTFVGVLQLRKMMLLMFAFLTTSHSFRTSLIGTLNYRESFSRHHPIYFYESNPGSKIRVGQRQVQLTAQSHARSHCFPTCLKFSRASQQFQQTRSFKSLNRLSMVWWFGGSSDVPSENNDDSCELVAVRIEAPSSNSRRIMGEIIVQAPLENVWSILTDYDNLSSHVPNLVDSRRIPGYSRNGGVQGDGSYTCRLYQRGAQKIIGFEFGASVTLDMTECVVCAGPRRNAYEGTGTHDAMMFPAERRIEFKCVDSFFFSEFDGEWRVVETMIEGDCCTIVSYEVFVRPRGPVPVAALEWRIREDVPTNLRAVKKASMEIGRFGVTRPRKQGMGLPPSADNLSRILLSDPIASRRNSGGPSGGVDWADDETMGAYLNK